MRSFGTTAFFCFAIFIIYSAGAQTVSVKKDDCAQLTIHAPNQDVAYQPGLDTYGNKVVPADLGDGIQVKAPTDCSISIMMHL